jgi:Fic family protein
MKVRDKKLAVLRHLSQEADPISFHQLFGSLRDDFDFKERSVRRWLNELVQEGLVERSGRKRGAKYKVAQRPGERNTSAGSCFGSDSLNVIEKVRRPIYERQPVAYNDLWFDSYQPNVSFYLPKVLRNQLYEAGRRSSNQDPAGTYAHQIFNRLLIDLSYNSSRLEGNTYSLLDTERLLLQGSSAEGKLDEEKVMILNHKEAIRYLVDNAPRLNISLHTVCTLHYLLADGLVEAKYAGKVRDHSVRIGGSVYLPFEDPKRLQIQLERITEKAAHIRDPFEQSLFLLVHISYLQAFADVNKRTARLSANISLVIGNLVPLSFNDVERDDYTSAMIAIYELHDVRPLVDLYAYSYMRTCAAYDSTIKAIGFDEVRIRYRQQRRAIVREIIVGKRVESQMSEFIQNEVKKIVPEVDQKAFIEDVLEDLNQMDSSRMVGLGITSEQLDTWLRMYHKN